MPKPAAPTAALTVYELKEVHGVSAFATAGRTRHKGMPVRRLWPEKSLARAGVHVLFNPGFTAPIISTCPNVTVFHDLQHKRHPEHFRWFDLPIWRIMLYAAVHRSRKLVAVSSATADDLVHFYRIPRARIDVNAAWPGVSRKVTIPLAVST